MSAKQGVAKVESVGGKNFIFVSRIFKRAVLWSVGEAERLKGSPPYPPEIFTVFYHHYSLRSVSAGYLSAFLQNFYREDLLYADEQFTYYSLTGTDGSGLFEKFSERFRRLYPGYMLDKHMHIVARPETPVINLQSLTQLLKSNDEALW